MREGPATTLSVEDRVQIVLKWLSSERSAARIARSARISEQLLYHWRNEFVAAGRRALRSAPKDPAQGLVLTERRTANEGEATGELAFTKRVLRRLFGGA